MNPAYYNWLTEFLKSHFLGFETFWLRQTPIVIPKETIQQFVKQRMNSNVQQETET